MKFCLTFGLALSMIALSVSPARADSSIGQSSLGGASAGDPTFDENGILYDNTGGLFVGPGVLVPNLAHLGALELTFFYSAPFAGTIINGDVLVSDVDGSESDIIRFTDAAGNLTGATADRMIFYSFDTGGGELADTGKPGDALTGAKGFTSEDAAGNFTWDVGTPFIYNGISPEEVPEPSRVMGMVGVAAMGLVGLGWRRRRGKSA